MDKKARYVYHSGLARVIARNPTAKTVVSRPKK